MLFNNGTGCGENWVICEDAFHPTKLGKSESLLCLGNGYMGVRAANAGWDGELFGNQKVAMLYGGSWITGVIEDTSTAKAAPLPVENGSYSMLYTAGWAITEQCKDKQAAAELIQFLSSDEELILGYSAGLINLPPTTTAMDKLIEEQSDDSFLPVYREVVKDGVDYGLLDSEFTDAYNKALENMLYNNVSVEDTLAAIVSGQ